MRAMDAEVIPVIGVLAPRPPALMGDRVEQAARNPDPTGGDPAAAFVGMARRRERERRGLHVAAGENAEPVVRPECRELDRPELQERLLVGLEERKATVRGAEQVVRADPSAGRTVLRREAVGLGVGPALGGPEPG